MKRKYFLPGETVKKANLRIIKTLFAGTSQAETIYLVRYFCCNKKMKLSERRIIDKERQNSTMCRECQIKKTRQAPRTPHARVYRPLDEAYFFLQANWPVTPLVRKIMEEEMWPR